MLHDAEISMIEHNEKHEKESELFKESIRTLDNENKVLKAKCDDLNDSAKTQNLVTKDNLKNYKHRYVNIQRK